MARFNPGPIGTITGKIGNYVVRKMNGKYFISLRPDSYKASQSEQSKLSRKRFGICVHFAKTVTNVPELSEVWSSAKIRGSSAYHRMIKHNIKLTNNGKLSVSNIVTPMGLDNPFSIIQFNKLYMSVVLNNDLIRKEYPCSKFKAYFIAYMNSPKTGITKNDSFRIFSEEVFTEGQQEIKLNFSTTETLLFNQYREFIIYSAAIWFSETNKINWSSTKAAEFNLSE